MKKIQFTNKIFFSTMVISLLVLIVYRGFLTIATGSITGGIQTIFQFVLYFALATRHRWTPVLLRYWAAVFLIGLPVFKIATVLLMEWGQNFRYFEWSQLYLNSSFILLGIFTLIGSYRFISIPLAAEKR